MDVVGDDEENVVDDFVLGRWQLREQLDVCFGEALLVLCGRVSDLEVDNCHKEA